MELRVLEILPNFVLNMRNILRNRFRRRLLARFMLPCIAFAMAATLLSSCFTGVESTKRVVMGREDKKLVMPTPEETFLADIKPLPLENWQVGKTFLVTDDRLGYVLERRDLSHPRRSLKGDTLRYIGWDDKVSPDGEKVLMVVFSDGTATYAFNSGSGEEKALKSFTTSRLPMMIDLAMVDQFRERLSGKQLWTRSPLWYVGDSTRITGKRYVSVNIDNVRTGDSTFPLRVDFTDESGRKAFMFMNMGNGGYDSRSFANLFSLEDLRKRYPSISDAHWENIRNSRVSPGMTKDECRLALGPPTDVNAGRSYSQTLDIWQYPDGTFLRFADGLLVDFRR